ncbi:MAG: ABC transporter permease subunit [Microbacteriaceae bacterium]
MSAEVNTRSGNLSRRRVQIYLLRFLLLAAVLGLWVYANTFGGVSTLILPEIGTVVSKYFEAITDPFMWGQAGITLFEMIVAYAIAVVLGLGMGFLSSRNTTIVKAVEPLYAWGYMLPFVLLYPLFLLWVGAGIESKIAYAAAGAFFPIAYNTVKGLANVDSTYLRVGRAYGAKKWQMDLQIKAGAARPMILSGLRIGISVVTIMVVLAELLGSKEGLGHQIEAASSSFQIANAYGYILFLITISATFLAVMERLLKTKSD